MFYVLKIELVGRAPPLPMFRFRTGHHFSVLIRTFVQNSNLGKVQLFAFSRSKTFLKVLSRLLKGSEQYR